MLNAWQNHSTEASEDCGYDKNMSDYKTRYRHLKRKLKCLIYENECFQEALRSSQRQLLKANRDKTFLLDRLLHYEKVDASQSESEEGTDSSEDDVKKDNNFSHQ